MGPLVPEIFNQEFNYVIALLLGIAFGYVLEQAGFSKSNKLAGLFYGYDFVVLRVFFTASITAMVGVLLLGNLGYLDLSLIYVNPTFLWSAIVGGGIMGVGFILGGFCPGTSIAAAAIGKIDAIVFVLGIVLGVALFGEIYPSVEWLYNGYSWGDIKISDVMGISPGLFIFLMILMALGAFVFTSIIEKRVNKTSTDTSIPFLKRKENRYVIFSSVYLVLGLALVIMPSRKDSVLAKISNDTFAAEHKVKAINPIELTYRIIDEDNSIKLIDTRPAKEFKAKTLPGATNIAFDDLFEKTGRDAIDKATKQIVFIDNDGSIAKNAAALAVYYGNTNVAYLAGGIKAINNTIAKANPADTLSGNFNAIAQYKFLSTASARLDTLAKQYALKSAPPSGAKKKTAGGC